jgi:lysyl-tRNA synthetase class 2
MNKNQVENHEGAGHVENEHELRVAKIKELREQGIEPWPTFKPVSATCDEARKAYVEGQEEQKTFSLAGRLLSIREHGKTIFANIMDRSGEMQVYIRADVLGEDAFTFFKKYVDIGDIIWLEGPVFKTKMGEVTLKVLSLELLSKCLFPLPEKYHGLSNVEQRYRQRYLDLISNPESREKFKKRSNLIQSIRSFLVDKEFMEVETPMLHPIPGGAAARPFTTHHNAYDMELYLRIAPELYLKRLVVGGFDRVFEINRNFRNEGVSTRHNPEFTMLEFYMAHGDYKMGMDLTEELLRFAIQNGVGGLTVEFKEQMIDFSKPFKRLSLFDSLIEVGGFTREELAKDKIDLIFEKHGITLANKKASFAEKVFALFEAFVEQKLIQPTFIMGHPVEISPLAKRDPNDPAITARFELFVGGMELSNGFSELNDPFDQADRFKQQVEARESGEDEAHHYDADYIHALEYGLPPTVGVGIGIDRLAMLITGTSSIKDVILFPTMRMQHS